MPTHPATMPTPVAVVDALNSLVEAEQNSVFRFLGEGSPYIAAAAPDVRHTIEGLATANDRRGSELYHLIQHLGGTPRPRGHAPDEAYLAHLSLKFLLPKLVDAKQLCIRRYENTVKTIGKSGPPDVLRLLDDHVTEARNELTTIEHATQKVLATK